MKSEMILALDVHSFKKAKHFVDRLYPKIKTFKVGMQLFTVCGPKIIQMIQQKGGEVFLDLKFLDIPNTVAQAVRAATRHKVKMLTLHISGGKGMLEAAVEAAKDEARKLKLKKPLLIGVTVLTSQKSRPQAVLKLAKIGIDAGLGGVVCSAQEAELLRSRIKKKFVIITPGIRPEGVKKNDQKRTATVGEALKAGSNFLVIGRPILEAKEPLKVIQSLKQEARS
ncbi:MAG: orotidine-5'-phosphate decarboxylase [Candidatus Omnitrophota bacterium]|nr:orotidine-5'-phosphate decarboxylase [Candidatus Omnitrophota bacterium]